MIDVINVSLVECSMDAASKKAIEIASSRCNGLPVKVSFSKLTIERTGEGDMFTYKFIITKGNT